MSIQKTLCYAAVLALVVLYIFKVEIPKRESEERKELLFPVINKASIEAITIKRGADSFELKNLAPQAAPPDGSSDVKSEADPKWELVGLPDAVLDTGSVGSLLSALSEF